MAPLPAHVPLATGLDLAERLVWVSARPYLSVERVGLQQEKEDQGKEGRKGTLIFFFLRVWGNLHGYWGIAFGRPGGSNHGGNWVHQEKLGSDWKRPLAGGGACKKRWGLRQIR